MDQRYLTACHEAGHAIATVMRGGTITSITIEPTEHYLGKTWTRATPDHQAFIIYAGPWAEARAQWPADVPLNDWNDEDGLEFEDYIFGAFLQNRDGDLAEYTHWRAVDTEKVPAELAHLVVDPEQVWCRELEEHWPVILEVADLLMSDQPVTTHTLEDLVENRTSSVFP